MIREYPVHEKIINVPERYYYFLSDSFRDEIIKIALIISIVSLAIGCVAIAIALK